MIARSAAALLVGLAPLLFAGEARADFRVCNKTAHEVGVAAAQHNGAAWESQGWWNIPPQQCAVVYPGELRNRYYYLYARHYDVGGAWEGDYDLCVQDRRFAIVGETDCEARGYRTVGFFEIDTGNVRDNWVQNLVE